MSTQVVPGRTVTISYDGAEVVSVSQRDLYQNIRFETIIKDVILKILYIHLWKLF